MWLFIVAFLLTTESRGCTEKANASNLIQFESGDFYASLHASKTMFVFFERYGRFNTMNCAVVFHGLLIKYNIAFDLVTCTQQSAEIVNNKI